MRRSTVPSTREEAGEAITGRSQTALPLMIATPSSVRRNGRRGYSVTVGQTASNTTNRRQPVLEIRTWAPARRPGERPGERRKMDNASRMTRKGRRPSRKPPETPKLVIDDSRPDSVEVICHRCVLDCATTAKTKELALSMLPCHTSDNEAQTDERNDL